MRDKMTRRQVHTIILQEERISELTKRNATLESGYRAVCKINNALRSKIKKLEKRENALNEVNI